MKRKEYTHITILSDESSPDIILGTYTPMLRIDLDIAKELVENRMDFTNGKSHYVLIDFTNVKAVTKDARDFMNDPKGGLKCILGGAFLSNNVVTTLFLDLYFRINKPAIPSRFFTQKEKALNWLKELKKH